MCFFFFPIRKPLEAVETFCCFVPGKELNSGVPSSLSPGIASLIRLLNSAGEESQPGLAVLLCEILTAVFLSLFVHGLATHCGGELFRIVGHPLSSKLWVTVFGGGARIPVMERVNSPARTPPSGQQAVQLMCLSYWQPPGVTGCVFVWFCFLGFFFSFLWR